jgi:hypothetical protein
MQCNDSSPRELLTALNALAIDSQHVYTVATKDRVELAKPTLSAASRL